MNLAQILTAAPVAYPRLLTAEDNGFQYHIAADAPGSTATLLSSGIAGLDPLPGLVGIRGLPQSETKFILEEPAHNFPWSTGIVAGSLYTIDLASSPRTVTIDTTMASRVEFARVPCIDRIVCDAYFEAPLLTTNVIVSSMPELTDILLMGSYYPANVNHVAVHDCPRLQSLLLSPLTGGTAGGSLYYNGSVFGGNYVTTGVDLPVGLGHVVLSGAFPALAWVGMAGARLQRFDLTGVTELNPTCAFYYGSSYAQEAITPDPVLIDFIKNLDRLGWAGSAVLSVQTSAVFDQTVTERANIENRGGGVSLING